MPNSLVISSSQINLTWADNTTLETGYTVERAPDNVGVPGTWAAIASLGANSTIYNNTGLSANTRYWYRVRAFNSTDVSAYSSQVSATTLAAPPAAPSNLQAQSLSSSRIDLTWTDNASTETGFYVERAVDNAGLVAAGFDAGNAEPAGFRQSDLFTVAPRRAGIIGPRDPDLAVMRIEVVAAVK